MYGHTALFWFSFRVSLLKISVFAKTGIFMQIDIITALKVIVAYLSKDGFTEDVESTICATNKLMDIFWAYLQEKGITRSEIYLCWVHASKVLNRKVVVSLVGYFTRSDYGELWGTKLTCESLKGCSSIICYWCVTHGIARYQQMCFKFASTHWWRWTRVWTWILQGKWKWCGKLWLFN